MLALEGTDEERARQQNFLQMTQIGRVTLYLIKERSWASSSSPTGSSSPITPANSAGPPGDTAAGRMVSAWRTEDLMRDALRSFSFTTTIGTLHPDTRPLG